MDRIRRLLVACAAATLLTSTAAAPAPAAVDTKRAAAVQAPARIWHTAHPDRVDLGWQPAAGATQYRVQRRDSAGASVFFAVISTTSFTDTQVRLGETYQYQVSAYGADGSSALSRPYPGVYTGRTTTTTVAVSPTPAESGESVVVTAKVTTADDGQPVATGEVEFFAGAERFATASVRRPGLAQLALAAPAGTITAVYRGDSGLGLGSGTSAPVNHRVLGQPVNRPTYHAAETLPYGLNSWPAATAVADVTGDGRPDALMTTRQFIDSATEDFRLWVFAQQPDGTLAEPLVLPTATGPASTMRLAAGDVDGDGDSDVVIPSPAGVSVLYQSAGGLGAPVTIPIEGGGADNNHGDVRLADMDGDGRTDIVAAGLTRVVVLHGTPNGTFRPAVVVDPAKREQIEVADLTGDGRLDVAVRYGRWHLTVHAQDPTGGYAPAWRRDAAVEGFLFDVTAIAVGDATGDGRADLAAVGGGNRPDSRLAVFPGRPADGPGEPIGYGTYETPESVGLTDMNGDRRADAVIVHGGWRSFSTAWQRPEGWLGTGYLTDVPSYAGNRGHRATATGDVSGDGKPDVLIADHHEGLIVIRQG